MFDQDGEIDFIVWLQEHLGWLEPIMILFTWAGVPTVLVTMMAIMYWCVDSRLGLRFGLFIFFFGAVNDLAKQAFRSPRPFWVSPEVETFGQGSTRSFGMPSGHAQASPVWFLVAERLGTRWARVAATAALALIGGSRVFLGVHSSSQVLVGWALGLAFLISFLWLESRFGPAFLELEVGRQLLAVAGSSVVMLGLGWLVITLKGQFEAPSDWLVNADLATGEGEPFEPANLGNVAAAVTAFSTTAAGALLLKASGQDRPAAGFKHRLLRLPVGLLILLTALAVTQAATAAMGGDAAGDVASVLQAMLAALLALGAIVFVAPLAFNRLGLSAPAQAD